MKKYYFLIIHFNFVCALSVSEMFATERVLVTTTEENPKYFIPPINKLVERSDVQQMPSTELKKLQIQSNVTNRYVHTLISAFYFNPANISQEVIFSVYLSDSAFLTGLIMEVKGKQYKAFIEEKEKAEEIYGNARFQSSALIQYSPIESNKFDVKMNVESQSDIVFYLTYEELLIRKHNKYEIVLNIFPQQFVEDLTVDIYIRETKPLLSVEVPFMRLRNYLKTNDNAKSNEFVKIYNEDLTSTHIQFAPNIDQQKIIAELLAISLADTCLEKNILGECRTSFDKKEFFTTRINGQFIVNYDVIRDPTGGQVLVSSDGYFVHFYSTQNITPIPKHIIFVFDVSHANFYEIQEAMLNVLDELLPHDYFNIIESADVAVVWNLENKYESPSFFNTDYELLCKVDGLVNNNKKLPPPYPATEKNINEAKKIVRSMSSALDVNIYDAFVTALNVANEGIPIKKLPEPIILFLSTKQTDRGELSNAKIIKTVNNMNEKNKVPIIFISFDTDVEMYKQIASENNGFVRFIYTSADVILQIKDLYKTISSPLLHNVKFNIATVAKNNVTKNEFHSFYEGSELIVAGKISNMEVNKHSFQVSGFTKNGSIDFFPEVITYNREFQKFGELEKIWAYLTVKQILEKETANKRPDMSALERAVNLSLKYEFVTPLTSLVVVKPSEENNGLLFSTGNIQGDKFNFGTRVLSGSSGGGVPHCFPRVDRFNPPVSLSSQPKSFSGFVHDTSEDYEMDYELEPMKYQYGNLDKIRDMENDDENISSYIIKSFHVENDIILNKVVNLDGYAEEWTDTKTKSTVIICQFNQKWGRSENCTTYPMQPVISSKYYPNSTNNLNMIEIFVGIPHV